MSLSLVTREEWGAAPALHQDPLVPGGVKYVGWSWTCSDTCSSREDCGRILRAVQKCHMGKKELADIKDKYVQLIIETLDDMQKVYFEAKYKISDLCFYNFMISSDGTIYEGRGWLANTTKTDPLNPFVKGNFLSIARIGLDFEDAPPTQLEIEAREKIEKFGVEKGYISPDYKDAPLVAWLG